MLRYLEMFKDLELKKTYDYEVDNLIEDFYIPLLNNSVFYSRITGYFSAKILISAAKGLSNFFINRGNYKLITGCLVSDDEYEAIKKGLSSDEIISSKCILSVNDLYDEIQKDYLKVLSYLVREGRLEIKIAIVPESLSGIFHEKIGIFEDINGNKLSFSGSNNETSKGWSSNIEEFKVFRSWNQEEAEYLENDFRKFNNYWNNNVKNFFVTDVPSVTKQNLMKIHDEDEDISTVLKRINNINKEKCKPVLYEFQNEAVNSWIKNGYKGILEMATGTGKTYTSLGAVNKIRDTFRKYCCIIVVPYKHLIPQWEKDVIGIIPSTHIMEIFGEINDWRNLMTKNLRDYRDGFIEELVLITTYTTFSNKDFGYIFKKYVDKNEIYLIIADEVHNFGSVKYSEGMYNEIKFRLGLSATPTRWFDNEGSDKIKKYFDKTVFKFDLKQAIDGGFLTHYEYNPTFVKMSDGEFTEYKNLTHKLTKLYKKEGSDKEKDVLKLILIKRSKIIKNNENKITKLVEILFELKKKSKIDHLLIYCDNIQQIEKVQKELNKLGIINHKFTEMENIKERENILSCFDNGDYQCLIATKCLDEGVNIPSTKTAIIIASSTNPKEYIQRRGRVLRKYLGKNKAFIYDITVLPPENIENSGLRKIEQGIIKKELMRIQDFLETADNKAEILSSLSAIMLEYNVYFDNYELN